jgi:hypothetical protein
MHSEPFDPSRAWLRRPDMFQRFRVPHAGLPLRKAGLKEGTELLVFERGGLRRALVLQQMAYHHLAQGELEGRPYLVSF